MPKHKKSSKHPNDDYLISKIKKLEKLLRRRKSRSSSPTDLSLLEDHNRPEQDSDDCNMENNPHNASYTEQPSNTNDLQISEQSEQPPDICLDESIIELLGEMPSRTKKYDPPIQTDLSLRWEHITSYGLPKDAKKILLAKYHVPQNCQRISAPILNPEIKAALSDILIKKDKTLESKQNQNGLALSCIGQALTKIFASQYKDADTIKLLIDAGNLLCDSQYIDSMCRRSFVTSSLKKDIKDHLYTTEIDSYLFGEKLSETLKSAKAINKSGAEMKNILQTKRATLPQSKFTQPRSLNSRPPLPLARQVTGAGRRSIPAIQQSRRYQGQPQPTTSTQMSSQHPPPQVPSSQRSRGRTQARR